ncbi:uncharacterized protein LOC124623008 [Schistocerca americana]|uniref:uncharacterized protein LOC124623008 n=1 Tax=Schistocerca americana TaxID=7009 RepID=UPI001F4FE07D|nr:uncharacterized protein LOC124623008 [Schistocerca americana]
MVTLVTATSAVRAVWLRNYGSSGDSSSGEDSNVIEGLKRWQQQQQQLAGRRRKQVPFSVPNWGQWQQHQQELCRALQGGKHKVAMAAAAAAEAAIPGRSAPRRAARSPGQLFAAYVCQPMGEGVSDGPFRLAVQLTWQEHRTRYECLESNHTTAHLAATNTFGPRRVPAAPSDFAAAPRAVAAAVAATTPTARPVDASRAASSGSAPGGRSGACGPSSVATAFGADGRRPLSRAAFPSGGCAACPAAAFLGHPQGV